MLTRSVGRLRRTIALVTVLVSTALIAAGCTLIPADLKHAVGQSIKVTAYFESVAGLYADNDIDVLGMPVGRVLSITPQGGRVKVEFTVDKDIPIPADATAAIINTSLVTTRHIELSPPYSEGPKLQDGDVITDAKSPVEIGTLFDTVDNLVEQFEADPDGNGPLSDMLSISSGIFGGNGARMKAAIDELSKAAQVGVDNGDALVEVIKNMDQLTSVLVENYPKMTAFSSSITQVSQMLGDQAPGLQATMEGLNQTLNNTATFLEGNTTTLGSSMGRLAAVISNLSDYSRQLVDTIDVAPLAFENLANSVSVEQRAWRAQVLIDKSLFDNELLSTFCEAINLQQDGCRTGKLTGFGPDLGVFSALVEMTK
ncbi:MAG: virulence factor Mce [Gordonia sp.]|uniref:MCE family protein n=1 Tax=Gordonia rubripertincta TaxID=36822 RepID=A0ABT4MQL4_GORRU|nr:MCE family protein [Gordonia rubripertincta]MBA4022492.1 virulence factor Mce [Gordonia sp. (in: high G+C Gram-positive bacteria)]MCZ4549129.1 MCE family protein [Gordonia rubripertincta]